MSWFDTKNFTSFATQAIKNAQKKIDKVLDIDESSDVTDSNIPAGSSESSVEKSKATDETENKSSNFSAWSAWGAFNSQEQGEKEETASSSSPEKSLPNPLESKSVIKTKISSRLAKKKAEEKRGVLESDVESAKVSSSSVHESLTSSGYHKDSDEIRPELLTSGEEKNIVQTEILSTSSACDTSEGILGDLSKEESTEHEPRVEDVTENKIVDTDLSAHDINVSSSQTEKSSEDNEKYIDGKELRTSRDLLNKYDSDSTKNHGEGLAEFSSAQGLIPSQSEGIKPSSELKHSTFTSDDSSQLEETVYINESSGVETYVDNEKDAVQMASLVQSTCITDDVSPPDRGIQKDVELYENVNVAEPDSERTELNDNVIPIIGEAESFIDVGNDISHSDIKLTSDTYIITTSADHIGSETSPSSPSVNECEAAPQSFVLGRFDAECDQISPDGIERSPSVVSESDASRIQVTCLEMSSGIADDSLEKEGSDWKVEPSDVETLFTDESKSSDVDISKQSEFTSSEISDLALNKVIFSSPSQMPSHMNFEKSIDELPVSQPISRESSTTETAAESSIHAESSICDLSSQTANYNLTEADAPSENKSPSVSKERPSFNSSDSTDTLKLDSSLDTTLSEEAGMTIEQKSDQSDESDASAGSSSYVKCMLEEAIEDSARVDNLGEMHAFQTEKTDHGKAESEGEKSFYSGHNSSDEIDTTTSSDIEIISTPTSNGEKNQGPPDFSPLRIALSRTKRTSQSHTHKRNDSQSSSSTNSRTGECEQLSPGRDSVDSSEGNQDHINKTIDEELDNPYETQKLLKPTTSSQQNEAFCKKLAETSEILQARENKLVQLSKENNELLETNSVLRNQLQQVEEAREAELEDITTLTGEFTERLSSAERKLQAAIKERDGFKKQLQSAQDELVKRAKDNTLNNLLKEKDQQLEELMMEGEKLSKQILQNNNIIKKLRSKEKENEALLINKTKKIDEQGKEISHLKMVLDSKEEVEKKQTDAIEQLNSAVQKQEAELLHLRGDQDDHTERIRSMQNALDNSYKEIAELHKTYAAKDSQAQEKVLSSEIQLREELKRNMEKEIQQYRLEKEALIMQIEDFRLSMSRMEKEHNRREDLLREEISDLQRKLQEDEMRTQDLTNSVTSATRPLLRQIENLQSTYTDQSSSWEKVEKNLTDRLADVHNQLAIAVEKERHSSEKLMELSPKVTSLETLTSRLKQEKSQLAAQLEIEKSKLEVLEDHKNSESVKIETVKQEFMSQIKALKKEKLHLETQLEMEKTKLDNEKKRFQAAMEQMKELERENQKSRGTPSPLSVSRQESVGDFSEMATSMSGFSQDELDRSFTLTSGNGNKLSLYESLRQSGTSNLLENLQSQIKMREGEITHLQSEIGSLERTRESMARELVNLTNRLEELQDQLEELPTLKTQHEELNQRYSAILQMYGEKVEEANELKLDLQDVTEMYKLQIEHLLSK